MKTYLARRTAGALLLGAIAVTLSGCSSDTPSAERSTATSSPSSEPVPCPNPYGGSCIGSLDAGTYATKLFTPEFEYEVTDGWANYEDLPGNFLLVPPEGTLQGVDAGSSDYIGVYTSVVAATRECLSEPADTGSRPQEIADWFAADPNLTLSGRGEVTVGGLEGVVMDLTMNNEGGHSCQDGDLLFVPLIIGQPPSSLEHAMISGLTMRLYLLEHDDGTLAIEVNDLQGGAKLDGYSDVVELFDFAE